ncbi:MAG: BON domain-containing protein [Bacteroidota bacterium]
MSTQNDKIAKRQIEDQLKWDDRIDAAEVSVGVENGKVLLTGTVPDFSAKLAAERDAYQIPNVLRVENLLEVRIPDEMGKPGDSEITDNIEKKLVWNNQIDEKDITIDVNDGLVTLRGGVKSFREHHVAENLASSVNGVVSIDNQLIVRPLYSIADKVIREDIREAYRRNNLVDEDNIHIEVKNGVVYLSGVVSHYVIKREAYDLAVNTKGVSGVEDNTTIG